MPAVAFDIDAPNAIDLLETLSENLQATVAASPEWQTRIKTASREREPGSDDERGNPFADMADDVAF